MPPPIRPHLYKEAASDMNRMTRLLRECGNWHHGCDVLYPMRILSPIVLTLLLLAASCGADAEVNTASSEPTPAPQPTVATLAPTPEPEAVTVADEELPDEWNELHASELAWVRSSILSYEYTFQRSCECDDATQAPRRVRVEHGRIASVTVDGERSDSSGYSIDDLYRQARVALFQAKEIGIDFAPNGVPTRGVIDVEAAAVDGGFVFTITDFEILIEGAPVDDEYLSALTAWRTARIGTYFLGYSPMCFCIPVELDVTVTDGEITNVVAAVADSQEPTERAAHDVDAMFVELRNAMVGEAHEINVDYHPTDGRPLSFSIDVDKDIVDEEWGVQVFAFEAGAGPGDSGVDPEYAEFCAAFVQLVSIDDTPETADQARENLDMMLANVETVAATAPQDVRAGALELRRVIETAYRFGEEADWDPQVFEDLDDEAFAQEGLDVDLIDALFDVVDATCEPPSDQ